MTSPTTSNPQPTVLAGRADAFLDRDTGRTPVLVLDLDVVAQRYRELRAALPEATVFYAMKANPHPAVLELLASMGCGVDAASVNELDQSIAHGIPASMMSYGNPVRRAAEITHAHDLGVGIFSVDDLDELDKLTRHAPGSRVLGRLNTEGSAAAWPLSRKFGTDVATCVQILRRALANGHTVGATFHVGSQQSDPMSWDHAISEVAEVLAEIGLPADHEFLVNLGGGLPGRLDDPTPALAEFAAAIHHATNTYLDDPRVTYAIEPGRFLVADAGVIETEVIGIVHRPGQACPRWAFIDVGLFGGLSEASAETIRYPITTTHDAGKVAMEPTVVAGPTCDSTDILYEDRPVLLPSTLSSGDHLRLHGSGAYTVSCSSLGFNGFEPLRVEVVPAS